MFKTIVVGVDGREGGRDALRLGAELARISGGSLIAAAAFPYFHRPALRGAPAVEAQREQTQAMLDRELAELDLTAETRVVGDASPGRALHLVAERDAADLIVVGSTHRGVVGRVLVGDDALGSLHGSPCSVAIAPRGFAASAGALRRIGVGFDEEQESRQALDVAGDLAVGSGAELQLLTVIESPPALGAEAVYSMDWLNDYRTAGEQAIERVIGELSVKADGDAVIGRPVDELVELSKRVDLLVVGSRGWGPVRRVLVGSTATGLARHAACPLIVVPRGASTGAPGEDVPGEPGTEAHLSA